MARNGCKKVIIVNGHGGNNSLLPYFAQSQLETPHDYVVYVLGITRSGPGEPKHKSDPATDMHAGESETSMSMIARPDLVHLDRAPQESGVDQGRLKGLPDGLYTGIWWYARFPNHYAGEGAAAVAAVGIAGNLTFIVLALTQMLGVGTTAVISHAVGRKDAPQAVMLFNQAQVLAIVTGVLFLVLGLVTRLPYARGMAADAPTADLAAQYLAWFVPAMALQFGLVAMSSALRAIGNFKTGMVVGTVTVILNMILAPFLIFGWGTGHPLGVAGAAVASLIAIVVGLVWLTAYFRKVGSFLRFDPSAWRPRPAIWKQMLGIGLPSGVEFGITTVYLALVYTITRPFGAAAQAGFGIGIRIIQAGFMPVVALAFP